MVNTWNQYQCMVTFNMSRSAYVRESGDTTILEEMVSFDNDETKVTPLMNHLKRSITAQTVKTKIASGNPSQKI